MEQQSTGLRIEKPYYPYSWEFYDGVMTITTDGACKPPSLWVRFWTRVFFNAKFTKLEENTSGN